MKATILRAPGPVEKNPLEFADVPLPEPARGEIRVHVKFCGVCRTDLHVVEGELPPRRPHVIPGHQVVGTVEKLGEGARRFALGFYDTQGSVFEIAVALARPNHQTSHVLRLFREKFTRLSLSCNNSHRLLFHKHETGARVPCTPGLPQDTTKSRVKVPS